MKMSYFNEQLRTLLKVYMEILKYKIPRVSKFKEFLKCRTFKIAEWTIDEWPFRLKNECKSARKIKKKNKL